MNKEIYKMIGARIRSARESVGLSQEQLANKMGFSSPASISHFEAGMRKISIADLHKLSRTLGTPIEFFISTHQPHDTQMKHFRLRAEAIRPSEREVVASFLAFAAKNGKLPMQLSRKLRGMKAGEAASSILRQQGIEALPVSPFEVAERLGIPVFQWELPHEVSGIFVLNSGKACIGVNQDHPYVRQRFSVAHELGHFVFHDKKDLFVDFLEIDIAANAMDENEQKQEMVANWFAADLLMPQEWVRKDFREYGEDNLTLMAQKYEVSEQALWFRCVNLKLVGSN